MNLLKPDNKRHPIIKLGLLLLAVLIWMIITAGPIL
jgi:hypothetical protein